MDGDLQVRARRWPALPSRERAGNKILNWIGFYNGERLREELDDLPSAEYKYLNIKTDNTAIVAATQSSLYEARGASAIFLRTAWAASRKL